MTSRLLLNWKLSDSYFTVANQLIHHAAVNSHTSILPCGQYGLHHILDESQDNKFCVLSSDYMLLYIQLTVVKANREIFAGIAKE